MLYYASSCMFLKKAMLHWAIVIMRHFFLIAMLVKIGVDVVFPIHAARDCDFRRGKQLGKKDHIVQWRRPSKPEWMAQETYDNIPGEISIREVSVHSARKGFRTRSRIIVTT